VLARYRYDVYGRRVRRDVGASTTIYLNDGHAVAEERDGAGTVLRQFVDGGGLDEHVELRRGDDARFFYHANVLNSVAAVTDAAGAVVERYRYDAYGVPTILAPNGTTVRSSSTIDNPYLFTGRRLDPESGLYHYRARYLHPQQGRFIHRDPRGAADGMNRYAYVGNNPVNLVDPFGTEKEEPSSSPKKPCPPENSIREKARETLWALAYEEGRVGSFEQFTAAYGAQDKTEHALFGEGAMMGMEPTVPGMSKPWEAISANGGHFLPKREHQIFVPGYGEVDLRWLVQGYATTGNPWGLEGFGGGVKWAGAELYSLQYTIPEGKKIGEGSFLGGITGPLAAHVVKTDANTQINHMSFEMGRQLRDGTLFKVQTGEWEDRYGMTHPIYRPGTLEDLARMTVGDPPTNDRYKQSSDVPPDWLPELGKTALKKYNNTPSGGDDCK
jgi:RHS repeat-associated protein